MDIDRTLLYKTA